MSLVLAVLYESNWLREDGAKLFFFGACFLALLALARYASRRSESSYSPMHEQPDLPPEPASTYANEPESVEPEIEDDLDEFPPARSVTFTTQTIQFKSFDVETGPPTANRFATRSQST
jgi:hypothetical protein